MDSLSTWLGAEPHRSTIVNVAMLSVILAMASSPVLLKFVGGSATLLFSLHFLVRAAPRTPSSNHLYNVALLWVPGALASALAIAGLYLAVSSEALSLTFYVGLALFGVELSFLVIAGSDLRTGSRNAAPGAN